MRFGEDMVNYQLFLKEDNTSKKLVCSYFDATLRKAVEIGTSVTNGVDVLELDRRMHGVNWQALPDVSADGFDIKDKDTWKQEAIIEGITRDLALLSATEEGAAVSNILKYKFWLDSDLQGMIPELSTYKSRYELSQRFYVVNGDGITVREAYRFLNNRWMERDIHAHNRLLRHAELKHQETKSDIKSISNKKKTRLTKENSGK